MKTVLKGIAITAAFSTTLATGIFIGTAQADQPAMWSALHSLVDARTQLQSASGDKGGHRARALYLVNEAIEQVHQGIDYARWRRGGWHDTDWH
jgi:hypothetical protein